MFLCAVWQRAAAEAAKVAQLQAATAPAGARRQGKGQGLRPLKVGPGAGARQVAWSVCSGGDGGASGSVSGSGGGDSSSVSVSSSVSWWPPGQPASAADAQSLSLSRQGALRAATAPSAFHYRPHDHDHEDEDDHDNDEEGFLDAIGNVDFESPDYHAHAFTLRKTGVFTLAPARTPLTRPEVETCLKGAEALICDGATDRAVWDVAWHFRGRKLIFLGT